MLWKSPNPAFSTLLDALNREQCTVHLVGGVVRDLLLNRHEITDLDLVLETSSVLAVARRVADRLGWAFYALDETRDVARLVFMPGSGETLVCDIAALRAPTLESDLLLRDFTVNAMALTGPLTDMRLVDPTGGNNDLHRRLIRRVSTVSLADDPVRLLRAVRFAAQLDFTIEDATAAQIRRLSDYLSRVSVERVRDELWKTLATPRPVDAIQRLAQLGLLPVVLPEIAALEGVEQSYPHTADVYRHTLRAVGYATTLAQWVLGKPAAIDPNLADALQPWRYQLRRQLVTPLTVGRPRSEWLVWYALLHDIGKPATRCVEWDNGVRRARFLDHETIGAQQAAELLGRLRFARSEIEAAAAVIRSHMRPHHLHSAFPDAPISRRAQFRFFRDLGNKQTSVGIGIDVLLLALADVQAIYGAPPPDWIDYLQHVTALLAYAFDTPAQTATPLVNGSVLMRQFDLQPGTLVGELLEVLNEAQMVGEVTTREEALAHAARWLKHAPQTDR